MFNIGIDRSGNLKTLPLYIVATREEGRQQKKNIIYFRQIEDNKYSKTIKDRDLKIYAILTFLAVRKVIVKGDQIHMCKDYPGTPTQRKFLWYIHRLFNEFVRGKYPMGEPDIEFHSRKCSKLVKMADKKCTWTRKGRYELDKCLNLYKYLECLD